MPLPTAHTCARDIGIGRACLRPRKCSSSSRRTGAVCSIGPMPVRPAKQLGYDGRKQRLSFPAVLQASQEVSKAVSTQEVVSGSYMEEIYDALAQRLLDVLTWLPKCQQYIVGIAGAPGSGKTTAARAVCDRVNQLYQAQRQDGSAVESAVVVPMDGFHYYRRELDAMPDPAHAHARRGAPFTFNAAAFVDAVRSIRQQGEATVPSFDHGVGDPVEGGHEVLYSHRVVLVEGNYLLLEEQPWSHLHDLFDERWFIDVDLEEAMARVKARQVGNGAAVEVAEKRVATNDRPNAELILGSRHRADIVVPSLPFKLAE